MLLAQVTRFTGPLLTRFEFLVSQAHVACPTVEYCQPVHLLSPLVASTYLLCGLLDIDYGDNQRVSLKWTVGTVMVMLCAAIAVGAITLVN